jgi:hypothetical protein
VSKVDSAWLAQYCEQHKIPLDCIHFFIHQRGLGLHVVHPETYDPTFDTTWRDDFAFLPTDQKAQFAPYIQFYAHHENIDISGLAL